MKITINSFESTSMPNLINKSDSPDFEDWVAKLKKPTSNKKLLAEIKSENEFVEKFDLNGFEIQHYKGRFYGTYFRENSLGEIDYIVRYTKSPVLMDTIYESLMQSKIWRSITGPSSELVLRPIFFTKLLPLYGRMVTDCDQTEAGQRMWVNLILDALKKNFKVYWLNCLDLDNIVKTKLTSLDDINKYEDQIWGRGKNFRFQLVVVSKSSLK